MKKEFKAPIVEHKQLSTANNIMDIDFVQSGEIDAKKELIFTEDTVAGFNQWKGFGSN